MQDRCKLDHLVLTGIVGGPKKPKSIQACLRAIVEDIELASEGTDLWMASRNRAVKVRVLLAFTQHDYPGLRDVALQMTAGKVFETSERRCTSCDSKATKAT